MSKVKLTPVDFKHRLYRRRYLLPNAVTVGNMFCGFLAIIYATSGRFDKAFAAIGFAVLLDGLDGRVARRFNATSKFGVEFDSFSDLVSFGVAPAIMMYNWCFRPQADEFGVFICFIFALCSAMRLARFNISEENLKSFTGLPTPGAAGMVAALIFISPVIEPDLSLEILGALVMLLLSYLMMSHIEFFSIKRLKVGTMSPLTKVALGALIALIWYRTAIGFLVLTSFYCFSPIVKPFLGNIRKSGRPQIPTNDTIGAA